MAVLNVRNVPDALMQKLRIRAAETSKSIRECAIEGLGEWLGNARIPWKGMSPLEAKAIIKESKAAARKKNSQDQADTQTPDTTEYMQIDGHNEDLGTRPTGPPEDSAPLSGLEILEQESAPHQVIPAWAADLPEGSEEHK